MKNGQYKNEFKSLKHTKTDQNAIESERQKES